MPRLIIVSNRVPDLEKQQNAGGLAVALEAAIAKSGGLWFGWSGRVTDGAPGVETNDRRNYTLATTDLSGDEFAEYYNGFSNQALWPLLHYRLDLVDCDAANYRTYRRLNERFADQLLSRLKPGDRIWIHDYHLIPLGWELRRRGITAPIGFFLHTPLPPSDIFTGVPWHRDLVDHFCAYDLVGFQTSQDQQNFADLVGQSRGATVDGQGRINTGERSVATGAYPIGIDTAGFAALAASPQVARIGAYLDQALGGQAMIIGVDRLDYSKGLPERFAAYESFLQGCPEMAGRVSFLQIAAPSREDVPAYAQIRDELDTISGRINRQHARFDWMPLRYINRSFDQATLAALFRRSLLALVTPLRDGMNIVAKEYLAAQHGANPGVLVLSQFAGAAERLPGPIIVNPHDRDAVARAIGRGLAMPLAERRARWQAAMAELRRRDISDWWQGFLADLDAAAPELAVPAASAAA